MKKRRPACLVVRGWSAIKKRKFNRHLAREVATGKVKGRICTRDGRPVRILAWDALGQYPIAGLIYMAEVDAELSWQWTRQGISITHTDTLDFTLIIELKETSSTARLNRAPKKKRK